MKGAETTELPTASTTDSDMESGSLMIDEGEKKKSYKRKSLTTTSNTTVSFLLFFFSTKSLEYLLHASQYCAKKEQLLMNILQKKFRNCRQTFLKIK